jgi:hypothetical protein
MHTRGIVSTDRWGAVGAAPEPGWPDVRQEELLLGNELVRRRKAKAQLS